MHHVKPVKAWLKFLSSQRLAVKSMLSHFPAPKDDHKTENADRRQAYHERDAA
jgi:hypothetical protein